MSNAPVPGKSWPDVIAPFSGLIEKLCGPAFEQFGLSWGERAYLSRLKRLARLFEKTKERLAEANIEPGPVKPALLHDIIDRASLEDDDDLQDRWVNLLAKAADGETKVYNSFPDILKSLSKDEAVFLTMLFDGVIVDKAAWYLDPVHYANLRRQGLIINEDELPIPRSAGNYAPHIRINMGRAPEELCFLSDIGVAFVNACTSPKPTRS
jgi:hypothetical protein